MQLLRDLLKEKSIVVRERTPVEIILYSVFLYLSGLSFRRVCLAMRVFIKRSRTSAWKWVHKFGDTLRDKYSDRLPEIVVIDETAIKVGNANLWFWFVIDPKTRKLVFFMITRSRTNLAVKRLLRGMLSLYGNLPSVVITDGGSWYLVLRRYGIEHKIVSGGIRNYVERLIETIKDRTRAFDNYFPSERWRVEHVYRWLGMYAFYYNWIRSHLSLHGLSPIFYEKKLRISNEFERFIRALLEVFSNA